MSTAIVEIKGVKSSGILFNRFNEEAEVSVSSGTAGVITNKQKRLPREEAESRAYMTEEGVVYFPGTNLYQAIIAAGTFHKSGKSKLTTQRTSLVPAGVMINEVELFFYTDSKKKLKANDLEVDSRPVVIPSTGGRIMRHRARLDEWKLKFSLDIDDDVFSEDLVRALVDDAGKKIGIGDFRPQRRGPFGRFVVTSWKVMKEN